MAVDEEHSAGASVPPASLKTGTLWNLAAFAVMAATGVLLNVFIGGQAGPVALGVFNQTYAVFVITSHLAVLGLHHSALTHTAREENPKARSVIAVSALLLTLATGALGAVCVAVAAPLLGKMLGSPATGRAVLLAAPGLFFFAINKVLLGLANGRRDMRAFAVGQATRYLLMLIVAVLWWREGWATPYLGLIFTVPETLVAVLFGIWSARRIGRGPLIGMGAWARRHGNFALRGCFHGMLTEVNARVDVLMLGLFLGDREVGLYSFAAMVAEGFFNVLIVVRNQVAPLLASHLATDRKQAVQALARRLLPRLWAGAALFAVLILAAYPVAVWMLMEGGGYDAAWPVLAILLGGMTAYGGFVPFDTILMQSGRPGWQSLQMGLIVAVNIVLNAALIPVLGMTGAAMATALSLLAGIAVLLGLCRRLLGFPLL